MDNRTFTLVGISRKGKNRVKEQGEFWRLVKTQDKVAFTDKPGPWHLLISMKNWDNMRWVHDSSDDDFMIVRKE